MLFHIIQTSTNRSLLYQGLPQKGKWIVIYRFLERPQNRDRRTQLIRRRLIKTKIVRPIQIGYDVWNGGRLLGSLAEMAFVQFVCLRLGVQYKFHRHTYIGRTSHLGKIQGGRPTLHTHARINPGIHARIHARIHADILSLCLARTHARRHCLPVSHARTHAHTRASIHADIHLCSI